MPHEDPMQQFQNHLLGEKLREQLKNPQLTQADIDQFPKTIIKPLAPTKKRFLQDEQ